MNATPRLCVELNGCIADNLNFLGMPDFGPTHVLTPRVVGAIEALAWLNGPFAYTGEVHITVECRDAEFYERAMQWLQNEHFSLRTGIMDSNIHCYNDLEELARLAAGMQPTIAVGIKVEPLLRFQLAKKQLLFDPQGREQHGYRAVRQTIHGESFRSLSSWREIMDYCLDSPTENSLT